MINLDRLITWLNQSTLQTTNNPLYQVIKTLIQAAQEFQAEQDAINTSSGGAIINIQDADFLTWSDESALLPNSRELLAGTGITFDDSIGNERTISSTGSSGFYDSPLTDGDLDETELIFAFGDCIIVQVPV